MALGRPQPVKTIWVSVAALALGLLAVWPHPAQAAPGDLDTSFGDSGIVRTHIGPSESVSIGMAMARDASGRLVVAGNHQAWIPEEGLVSEIVLARYLPSGVLDTSFGTGGIVQIPSTAAGTLSTSVLSMVLDSAGRIVVAGQAYHPSEGPTYLQYDAMVLRFLPNGDLDTSFGGGDGIVVTDFSGGGLDSASGVAVDDSDRVLITSVTGAYESFDNLGLLLARYTASGELDTTFGGGDGYITELPPISEEKGFFGPQDLALDDSGRIVVVGGGFAAVRFLASGVLDTSFGGGDGWVNHRHTPFDEATEVAIDPAGNILLGGRAGYIFSSETPFNEYDFAVVRYSESGDLDTSFGDGDSMAVADVSPHDTATDLAIDENGRIILGGYASFPAGEGVTSKFAAVRFLPSGRISGSFGGGDGVVVPDLGDEALATSVAVDDSGQIVQAGVIKGGNEFEISADFALVRYEGGPAVDVFHDLTVGKEGEGEGIVTGLGIDCGSACAATYDEGTLVTLTATPDDESAAVPSEFTGWSGDCTGTGMCQVTMDAVKSVAANFDPLPEEPPVPTPTWTLNVTKVGEGSGIVAGPGINCGSDCSETYDEGTVVTLTATPDEGSHFAGWSGDCAGTGTCQVTMDAAKAVTASFDSVVEEPPANPPAPPLTSLLPLNSGTAPAPTPSTHAKRWKCKKGFKKRKVRGKTRCVKKKGKRRR